MSRLALTPTNTLTGTADPTVPTPRAGDVFWRSDLGVLRQYDGSNWVTIGPNEISQTFGYPGTVAVATGKSRFYLPYDATLLRVAAGIDTQPTGSNLRVDVNKNGTTVFTTQGNRPLLNASNLSSVTNMDVTAYAAGDYATVDVDAIGSTVAGADLTVTCWWRKIG